MNPLRCIMRSPSERLTYFQAMSTAMAYMCDVSATVMDRSISPVAKTFGTVNQRGIWYSHEFPTLSKGKATGEAEDPRGNFLRKKVNLIEAISTDEKTSFKYWVRPGVRAKATRSVEWTSGDGNSAREFWGRATCAKVTDAEVKEHDDILW